jgi:energy-coupling factor transporter ATP-binding protein EcfA2
MISPVGTSASPQEVSHSDQGTAHNNQTTNGSSSAPSSVDLLLEDKATPRWLKEVDRFLPIKSNFVLSGNIRDRQPCPGENGIYDLTTTQGLLVDYLRLRGFKYFLSINPVQGITVLYPSYGVIPKEAGAATVKWIESIDPTISGMFASFDSERLWRAENVGFQAAVEFVEKILHSTQNHAAIVFNMGQTEQGSTKEIPAFVRSLIGSYEVKRFKGFYNTVFWLCDRENDLPPWFVLNNPRIRSITLSAPDIDQRSLVGRSLLTVLEKFRTLAPAEQDRAVGDFCTQTDGMLLNDLEAITHFLTAQGLEPTQITEGVRRYKLGVKDDPWRKIGPREFKEAEVKVRSRVRGQEPAIVKSLDIIRRAVVGLAGAHVSRSSNKPKGVLFFAGPTGVGKTELAKSITQALFGDETAYIRFDMSEFNHEHSDQRLIGAPPGYLGFEAGGELTDAIRARPFSVVLFDEIEKAHPRILDKFLQILDDGQLTSGKGERVYFNDALIIFTSNLGMQGVRSMVEYPELEQSLRQGITEYFTNPQKLNRPELLNRIGDNIVVFDFIRPAIALQILRKMILNTLERLRESNHMEFTMSGLNTADSEDTAPAPGSVFAELALRCNDNLSNGGRGIGNMLESGFINPLSRAIFEESLGRGSRAHIASIRWNGTVPTIDLEVKR